MLKLFYQHVSMKLTMLNNMFFRLKNISTILIETDKQPKAKQIFNVTYRVVRFGHLFVLVDQETFMWSRTQSRSCGQEGVDVGPAGRIGFLRQDSSTISIEIC